MCVITIQLPHPLHPPSSKLCLCLLIFPLPPCFVSLLLIPSALLCHGVGAGERGIIIRYSTEHCRFPTLSLSFITHQEKCQP